MKNKVFYTFICALCVLVGYIVAPLIGCGDCNPEVRVVHHTDTLYTVLFDTIVDYYPEEVHDTILDYVFIENDTVLPILQKYYHRDSAYDVWVSGVEPLNMDSVNVFTRTDVVTVTNTETKTIVDRCWSLYAIGGLGSINGVICPEIGFDVTTPNKLSFGGRFGVYSGFGVIYGINIGFKIFEL